MWTQFCNEEARRGEREAGGEWTLAVPGPPATAAAFPTPPGPPQPNPVNNSKGVGNGPLAAARGEAEGKSAGSAVVRPNGCHFRHHHSVPPSTHQCFRQKGATDAHLVGRHRHNNHHRQLLQWAAERQKQRRRRHFLPAEFLFLGLPEWERPWATTNLDDGKCE